MKSFLSVIRASVRVVALGSAALVVLISASGCGTRDASKESQEPAAQVLSSQPSTRVAPSAQEVSDSVRAAYQEKTDSGYSQAVSTGYTGPNVRIEDVVCQPLDGSNFRCIISVTLTGGGDADTPSSVTYPVSVGADGCWRADGHDEYSSQTSFSGCLPS